LDAHANCRTLNDCAIQQPNEENNFKNQSNKERLSFVVYADMECVLRKTELDIKHMLYTYQQVSSSGISIDTTVFVRRHVIRISDLIAISIASHDLSSN